MLRPDYWTKHIFILPGIMLAFLYVGKLDMVTMVKNGVLGLIVACLAASSNYVINEYLDRNFDKFHPVKKQRVNVTTNIPATHILTLYTGLLLVSYFISFFFISKSFFLVIVFFTLMGVVYNVPPIRTKDLYILDILSESVNNPVRLILGWVMVSPYSIPPSSLILFYFFTGCFLMTSKRLSEYLEMEQKGSLEMLKSYRGSFKKYNRQRLTDLMSFFYGTSIFLLTIFMFKYKIEFLFIMPFFIILFVYYSRLSIAISNVSLNSVSFHKDKVIKTLLSIILLLFIVLYYVNLPKLEEFFGSKAILFFK